MASLDLGVGINSTMSGRFVPTLAGGLSFPDWAVSGSSAGVKNAYYYQSVYTLNGYRTWKSGSLFWGDVESGFGAGLMYAARGFQDKGSAREEKASDVALGPAFRVRWLFAGPVYLNLEMIIGIRNIVANLTLNAQDDIVLSIGVPLW